MYICQAPPAQPTPFFLYLAISFFSSHSWTFVSPTSGDPASPECVAAYCSVLQCVAVCCRWWSRKLTLRHTATHCNTLQHTATHCNTLVEHVVIQRCSMSRLDLMMYRLCNTLQRPAPHCDALQHTTKYLPEKLYGDWLSTPVPLFCLICTVISNKTGILD